VKEHGLGTGDGGAFMWQAVCDEESSRIGETLSVSVLVFGIAARYRSNCWFRNAGASAWISAEAEVRPFCYFEGAEEVRIIDNIFDFLVEGSRLKAFGLFELSSFR
jgi:hypothetical protein